MSYKDVKLILINNYECIFFVTYDLHSLMQVTIRHVTTPMSATPSRAAMTPNPTSSVTHIKNCSWRQSCNSITMFIALLVLSFCLSCSFIL